MFVRSTRSEVMSASRQHVRRRLNRRAFLGRAALAGAVVARATSRLGACGAGDRLSVGVVGLGRGMDPIDMGGKRRLSRNG